MASGDGNGWVECRCGHRHWGRFGAAGLAIVRPGPDRGADPDPDPDRGAAAAAGTGAGAPSPDRGAGGEPELLLQLRSAWTHQGGTWALPGGAADSHEDAVAAALREAHEEVGVEAGTLRVVGERVLTDHEDWRYTTVVALAGPDLSAGVANGESDEVRWVPLGEVASLPLHPAFALGWSRTQPALREAVGAPSGGRQG